MAQTQQVFNLSEPDINAKDLGNSCVIMYLYIFVYFSHLACDEERVEAAKLLVEHGASIYIENKEEKTPLQLAKGGLGSLLRRLVEGWWICTKCRKMWKRI